MIVDPFEPPPTAPFTAPPPAPTVAPHAYRGPFDREAWPERLTAHVVSPGDDARIHGYPVAGDLARFYGIAELAWLALRGTLPTASERAALDAALVLLAPVHVGEAPSHAALLSRIAGAPPSATIAIAAVGLGEQARAEHARLAGFLDWLAAPHGPVPIAALADDATAHRDARAWLHGQLRSWFGPDAGLPDAPLSRIACGHLLLHRLGMRGALAVETLLVWARLPAVIAEAAHTQLGAVRSYPARLPDYQYQDDHGASP